jgi:hypothetical protein|tara:strand:+ start:180 stop:287 length:108 start_codon:yes stop_codon:yes gene_type:complete
MGLVETIINRCCGELNGTNKKAPSEEEANMFAILI